MSSLAEIQTKGCRAETTALALPLHAHNGLVVLAPVDPANDPNAGLPRLQGAGSIVNEVSKSNAVLVGKKIIVHRTECKVSRV
jgi:hypothetical protein